MNATDEVTKEAAQDQEAGFFVGGEIHIIADPKTGSIMVNAPKNLLIAFGMLEVAKAILTEQQKAQMKKEPAIKVVGANALPSGRPN